MIDYTVVRTFISFKSIMIRSLLLIDIISFKIFIESLFFKWLQKYCLSSQRGEITKIVRKRCTLPPKKFYAFFLYFAMNECGCGRGEHTNIHLRKRFLHFDTKMQFIHIKSSRTLAVERLKFCHKNAYYHYVTK